MKNNDNSLKFYDILFLLLAAAVVVLWSRNFAFPGLSDYRPGVLNSLLKDIKAGNVPEFLSQIEHSYGFAFYFPYIAYFLHIENMKEFMIGTQLFFSTVIIISVPLLLYVITHKKIVIYVAPILLHIFCGNFLYGYLSENYWAGGYSIILGLPLLYLFTKTTDNKEKYFYTVVIGLMCSVFNIFRNHMSFPILITFLVICILELLGKKNGNRERGHTILRGILFFILYYLLSDYVPLLIGIILNRKMINNEQFMWHAFLAGLGVFDNKYGLAWDDEVIRRLVDAKYGCGTEYKDLYYYSCKLYLFDLIKKDPIFVFSTWIIKFLVCMGSAFKALVIPHYRFIGIRGNLDSPIFPIVVFAIITIVLAIRRMIKREEILAFVKYAIIIIIVACLGTVQAVIGFTDIKYYFATYVALSTIPFFGSIAVINLIMS